MRASHCEGNLYEAPSGGKADSIWREKKKSWHTKSKENEREKYGGVGERWSTYFWELFIANFKILLAGFGDTSSHSALSKK